MSEAETLRMAAEVVDKFSGPLRQMQKTLRTLSDQVKGTHKQGKVSADEHTLSLKGLHESVRTVTERVRSGLDPAMEGLGVTAITVAGAIAAVSSSIKEFAGSSRDLSYLSRQTRMTVNELRVLQELAPRIGISAQAMGQSMQQFGDHMERLRRAPKLEMNQTWKGLIYTTRGANLEVKALADRLQNIPNPRKQLEAVLEFTDRIRDPSQKRQFLTALGLDPAFANKSSKELTETLKDIQDKIGDLSDEAVQKGIKAQNAFDDLATSVRALKEEIGSELAGELTHLTESITHFIEANKDDLIKTLREVAEWIEKQDWKGFAHEVKEAASEVNKAADEFGGWKTVLEGLVAIKIIGWLAGVRAGVAALFGLSAPSWLPHLAAITGVFSQGSSKGPGEPDSWGDIVDKGRAEGKSIDEIRKEHGLKSPSELFFGGAATAVKPDNLYKPFQLPDFTKGEQPKPLSQAAPPEAATWLKDIDKSTLALKAAEWAVWGAAKVPAIAAKVPHLESAMAWGPSMAGSAAMWAGGKLHEETHSHEPVPSGDIMRGQRGGKSLRDLIKQDADERFGKQSALAGKRYASLGGSMNDASSPLPVSQWTADPKRDLEQATSEGTRKGVFDGLSDYFRSLTGGAGAGGAGGGAGFGARFASLTTGGPGGLGGESAGGISGPQAGEPGHAGETTGSGGWKGLAGKFLPKSFVGAGENALSAGKSLAGKLGFGGLAGGSGGGTGGALEQLRQYGRQRASAMGQGAEAGAAGANDEQRNIDNYMKGLAFLETDNDARKAGQSEKGNTGYFRQNANDAAWAKAHGLPDPRYGSYGEQAKANFAYMKKYPGAQEAIRRGDFATASRILNKNWVGLPGGSQPQSAAKMREYQKILSAGGGGPSGVAGAPIMPGATSAVGGKPPDAFIFHHTSGRGSIEGVKDTLRQRGLGVEYIMDREGNIQRFSGPGAAHMMRGWGKGAGLSNRNTVGMEVIAKNNRDVTTEQVRAAQEFMRKNYPNTPVFGHGEVNPGHKEADEGMAIVGAIRGERAAGMRGNVAAGHSWPGASRLRKLFAPKTAEDQPFKGDLLNSARKVGMLGDVHHKVAGEASVSVDFKNMPRGVQTSARGEGMFKEVKLNRGRAMPLASQEA